MTIAAALALGAAPALAQQMAQSDPATRIEQKTPAAEDARDKTPAETPRGMVNVTVPDVEVLGDFVNDDQAKALDEAGLPVSVEVAVGIAANACGIDTADLAKQKKDGTPSCTARNGSRALAEAVIKQKLKAGD
jgi:hypothetical protein